MTDEKIMTLVSRGKFDGARILFIRYNKKIYNFFLRLTFNREVSLDLMQDVFYRILKYRDTWREEGMFRPWIFRICRNEYNDYLKKEGRFQSNSMDIDEIKETSASLVTDPSNSERVKNLHDALAKISPDHRKILLLSKYMKLKNKEIAEIMDTNENAVKAMVFRAMTKLREAYFRIERG
jgi:RNA polymerase sigma-70 factor (ECF subfamily)